MQSDILCGNAPEVFVELPEALASDRSAIEEAIKRAFRETTGISDYGSLPGNIDDHIFNFKIGDYKMNDDVYLDTYRATIPKIIDYGCIMIAFLFCMCGFIFGNWHPALILCMSLIILCIPFILSRIPGKIFCNGDIVALQDLYHGKKAIPIEAIKEIEVKIFSHNESFYTCHSVHHYIFEMKIITDQKNYKFKMDAKKNIVEQPGFITDTQKYANKVAFLKLKKYIEAIHYINQL